MIKNQKQNYITLHKLGTQYGEIVPCTGNQPVILDNPNMAWIIESGHINLFLVEIRNGEEQSLRQHIMHCEVGMILPGVINDNSQNSEGSKFKVIAKGIAGTILRKIPLDYLNRASPAEVAKQIDNWIISFSKTLSRFVTHIPRPTTVAEPNTKQNLEVGIFSARKDVVWISELPHTATLYMDVLEGFENVKSDTLEDPLIPLTRMSWLSVLQDISIVSTTTEEVINQGLLSHALSCFHMLAFDLEHLNRKLALVDDTNLERIRNTSRNTAESIARQKLFNIYDLPTKSDAIFKDYALVDALEIISDFEKITFNFPQRIGPYDNPVSLTAILDSSGIRSRSVDLNNNDKWWNTDGSAILAYLKSNGQPVALVPGLFGRYWMLDPTRKTKVRVTAQNASLLQANAWVFYRPFPTQKVKASDLLKIGLHRCSGNMIRLILAGIPKGLLQIIPALAFGITLNLISDGGGEQTLLIVSLAVIAFGIVAALLHILQNKSLMNIQDLANAQIESAFWDRILRLPTHILNIFPTSEIALSAMNFQHFRNGEQLPFIENLLSVIFMLPMLIYIFFIDFYLGLTTFIICGISLILTLFTGIFKIEPQGKVLNAARNVSSRLFQIIESIVKLRIERAEGSAYAIWANDYRTLKQAELELGAIDQHTRAFNTALPFLAGTILYFVVAVDNSHNPPIGDFLMAFIIFLTFLSATTRLGESIDSLGLGVKAIGHLKPLLDSETEVPEGKEPLERLNGDVLFDRVSFRYDPDGPLILDDITIHVRPGEFVAIAGESGAGKSTLVNLALGINQPTSGAILYDGHDLRHLNLKQLRRKIGTVPQLIKLHPQDIWDNIAINYEDISTDMVWETARAARIEDQIKAMPMGLMTLVGTSGSVLSGGESQRINLARSLLGNPRVMILDEATNWLDNESQAQIMQKLSSLLSTRIVIAHRLSTLEKADRIYVLKAGKIVQSGRFQDLRETDGVFKDLITRQKTQTS